jgi:hypothetical protein
VSSVDLSVLARKYVWWEQPAEALSHRSLFLCQLMQLGAWDDVQAVRAELGDDAFREALERAPPGILDAKSWNYWNRFYKRVPVPPAPKRPLP